MKEENKAMNKTADHIERKRKTFRFIGIMEQLWALF